jgi:hypothetical protein
MMVDQNLMPSFDSSQGHLFAWMTGHSHLMDAMRNKFYRNKYDPAKKAYVPIPEFQIAAMFRKSPSDPWASKCKAAIDFYYCDASVYDGVTADEYIKHVRRNELGFPVKDVSGNYTYYNCMSPRATRGNVFHPSSNVSFVFEGGSTQNTCGFRLKTTSVAENPVFVDSEQDTLALRVQLRGVKGDYLPANHSRREMARFVKSHMASKKGVAVPAARKRAGDAGQIEHCKQNNLIFVTCDTVAAETAASRDVPVVFVKTPSETLQFDHDNKAFVQYSFTMCGSREARAALRHPFPLRQQGGSRHVGLQTTLFAVTVLMAIFGTA